MDNSKRHASQAQIAALVDFMTDHAELAKGLAHSGLEKEDLETQWQGLTTTLNSMGGAIKSVDKWKQTWRDLKCNTKKRALLKQQQSMCDTSMGPSSESQDNESDNFMPPKKKFASFDEEIIKIERDKLELDREYKVQKIEALSRIASALEDLARKKSS